MLKKNNQIVFKFSSQIEEIFKSLNIAKDEPILSDDIFRYFSEEEKHSILRECGIL